MLCNNTGTVLLTCSKFDPEVPNVQCIVLPGMQCFKQFNSFCCNSCFWYGIDKPISMVSTNLGEEREGEGKEGCDLS